MIAGPGQSRLKRPPRASALPVGEKSSDSAVAEDVLDSQPVEPTAMEDQPGQQTVALLRGQVVSRRRDLALPDRMAEQGSERIDVGDSPSLRDIGEARIELGDATIAIPIVLGRWAQHERRNLPSQRFVEDIGHIESSAGHRTSRVEVTRDRKSTRLNSSHVAISYAVF